MSVDELRQEQRSLHQRAKQILDTADRERRDLTPSEARRFDALSAEVDALKDQIDGTPRPTLAAGRQGDDYESREVTGKTEVLGREQRMVDWARTHGKDTSYSSLSIGAFLRSMITGPKNDIERRALSEGTDSAGGFLTPEILLAEVIDKLRAKTVVFKAGAQTVPLTTDVTYMARILTDPTAAWKTENTAITPSQPSYERITFKPQTLTSLTVASREVVDDAINIESVLSKSFTGALGVELDRAALRGSGTPPEPQGIKGSTGVGSVSMGTNGAAPTNYTPLLSAVQVILDANGPPPTAVVMSPRSAIEFGKLQDTTNQPMRTPPALDGVQFFATTSMVNTETQGTASTASTAIVGDFSQLLIGIRQQLVINVLRERYMDNYQYGFVASLRADVQLVHAASFCQVVGIL